MKLAALAALLLCLAIGSCYVQRHGLDIYLVTEQTQWEASYIERVEIQFVDKFCFGATTYHLDKIEFPFSKFKHHVEYSFRRRICDITRIIHNHPPEAGPRPSALDMEFLQALREHGFAGRFCIYHAGVVRDY